jgi:hypothetical protein
LLLCISGGAAFAQSLTVGQGEAKVGALLQFWAVNDSTAENYQYRIRRAEFKITGSVVEKTRYFLMIDPSKSLKTGPVAATNDNKILQDFGVAFTLADGLELVFGQFKVPTTPEGLDSSSELLLPERAYVSRTYGDFREPGIMLAYKVSKFKASVMSSNGHGTNADDSTIRNEKDLHARIEFQPWENLGVGAFTTAGDSGYQDKGRWGANLRASLGSLLFRADAVRASDPAGWSTGYAGDLSYAVNDRLRPVVRYEGFDNGTFIASAATVGLNYYLAKNNAKIQAAYSFMNDMSGTYAPLKGKEGSLFIMNFQMAL